MRPPSLAPDAVEAQPFFGVGQTLRRADMEPFAVMDQRREAVRLDRAVPERVQREGAVRRAGEKFLAQDLDASKEVGRHLALATAADAAHRVDEEIARPVIAERGD